jgi:3-hydroxyacyl-CoA dehydrogenase/SAM-dependent methyltransferase
LSELKIAIVGAGLMGSQIGCEYALGGHRVTFVARDPATSRDRVARAFTLAATAGIATSDEAGAAAERVAFIERTDLLSAATDVVVESVPEELGLKASLLTPVARRLPDAIIATNTSSIPITELGEAIGAPERTIGTHYWNPPLLMPPVEIIPGTRTRSDVVDRICGIVAALGKEPVVVESDVPGFIWNRLQLALLREALWLVENGVASPRTVDQVVRSGLARRLRHSGPFETVALGGLDSWTKVAENLFPVLSTASRPAALERWLEQTPLELDEARLRRDRGLVEDLARSRTVRLVARASTMSSVTEVAAENAEAREAWNGVLFDRFVAFRDLIIAGIAAHGDEAIRLEPPSPGDRVLDVGCGFGDSAQQLAQIVGPEGSVLGVDVAPRFVAAAREEAAAAGVANVRFDVADVELTQFAQTFDYAFARFGTMFFANPVAAFRNVCRALEPGGRFVCVVWRRKLDNPWMHVAEQVVKPLVDEPEETDEPRCGPGPFSQANADTLSGQLLSAGFTDIELRRFDRPIRIGRTLAEAVAFNLALGPAAEAVRLAGDDAAEVRPRLEELLRGALAQFQTPDGLVAGASTWLVTARAGPR